MHTKEEKMQAFGRLLDIMDDLRSQCPWDKKQTMLTLRPLTMEELYELTDAILEGNMPEIKKELGDVLLHLIFYAKIASETQTFDIADVIHSLCEKLIERHPHIYGNVSVKNEEEVKKNWEKIKLKTGNKSVLGGVPKSLPALVKAFRIQEKVAGVGFDWENKEDVWTKVEEEISELESEEEKQEFLEMMGLDKSGLDRLVIASYDILGLMSYLTAGEVEVRAWTIRKGTKAPQAAGKIHSDIERGFIKAEIVSYDDLIECGSMVKAREKGLIRMEGKEYTMKEGDIVDFKFNV